MSEHGVSTEAELRNVSTNFNLSTAKRSRWSKTWKPRIDENRELSRHVSAYLQNRKIAQQSKHAENLAEYQETHRRELTAYQAAAAYFKAQKITKLPNLKQLKAEREELIFRKGAVLPKVREAHKAWLDLATAQQNLEALHRAEGRREMTRGGLHELDK